jgi:uncharacterized membrane protein
MYGWLVVFMVIIGVVLLFVGVMELFVIKKAESRKVGRACLLAGAAILVAVAVLVERFILRV